MKKALITSFALFFLCFCHGQIRFEPGYFIDNNDNRIECLIRNVDWKNNPTRFDFKLTSDGNAETGLIANIKEFQVTDEARYVRAKVKMNRSSDITNTLDSDKTMRFNDEEVFLKTLSDGDGVLYYYEDNNLRRFFFTIGDLPIEPLIYKRYQKSLDVIVPVNTFKQQLWNSLKCESVSRNKINTVKYRIDDLTELFEKYNRCKDPDYDNNDNERNKIDFKLTIRPGVDLTSLSITNTFTTGRDIDFGQQTNFRLGAEMEGILPFNKNKWSLFVEPTYRSFKAEGETEPANFNTNTQMVVANYKSIELPMGFRHYMFLSSNSKLFLNAAYVLDFQLNGNIEYSGGFADRVIPFGSNASFAFGIGFKYNDKFGIEARYLSKRELFGNAAFASYFSDYSGFSIILGYSIL